MAFIDARDLGEAAATVLIEHGHAGKGYHLTGPEAIHLRAATLLSEVLARTIRDEPGSILGYVHHLRRQGLVVPQAVVRTILHAGLRRGDAGSVTDDLPRLLGRPARTVRAHVEDHTELWARPDANLGSELAGDVARSHHT